VKELLKVTVTLFAALAACLTGSHGDAREIVYLDEGSPLYYLRGYDTPAASWKDPDLTEEASWTYSSAGFGIGYGDGDDRTLLEDMRDGYVTVYVRAHFEAGPELASPLFLKLESHYDDGFVAYLNGTEIGRASIAAGALEASDRARLHEVSEAAALFMPRPDLLREGDNVLAVEVHNASKGSSDLSYRPHLAAYDSPPSGGAVYLDEGLPIYFLRGYETPAASWKDPDFVEDGSWTYSGAGLGIGYGDDDDRTVLEDMRDGYVTVYLRAHFRVGPERSWWRALRLESWFDDGFVAYLNGTELGRAGLPAGPVEAGDGAASHEVTDGSVVFTRDADLLREGDNVLAVEVHNRSIGSSDLSYRARLEALDSMPVPGLTHGPYLQQLGRRSVLVVWETDMPAETAVDYGLRDTFDQRSFDAAPVTHHVALLDGLRPATDYAYRIASGGAAGKVGRFRTEVDRAGAFTVAAYGDTRSNHSDHAAVIAAMIPHKPDLGIHVGDLVGDGDRPDHWAHFFRIEADLLRHMALYPVLGNHEESGALYKHFFELPQASPAPEQYYAFDYATAYVIAVDQYLSDYGAGSEQYTWLEQQLSAASQRSCVRHTIVFLHHGPYSSSNHGSNGRVRSDLVPLFEAYGVDIVFAGHDHAYERSTVNGVKYVVTGGGGAPLYSVSGDWWTDVAESTLQYCILQIEGPRLEFEARREDGSLLDSFVLGGSTAECQTAADCTRQEICSCLANEAGEWRCVHGGCIWNCSDCGEDGDGNGVGDLCEEPPVPADDGGTPSQDSGAAPDPGVTTDPGVASDPGAVRDLGSDPGPGPAVDPGPAIDVDSAPAVDTSTGRLDPGTAPTPQVDTRATVPVTDPPATSGGGSSCAAPGSRTGVPRSNGSWAWLLPMLLVVLPRRGRPPTRIGASGSLPRRDLPSSPSRPTSLELAEIDDLRLDR